MTMINRRKVILSGVAGSAFLSIPGIIRARSQERLVDQIVIDLPREPVNIHPAKAYADIDWSIVHSVFDALIGFDQGGDLLPIAAETFTLLDDLTWETVLRPGMTFHDGSPVTSDAIKRGFDLITGSDSLVSDVFSVVDSVEIVDDLTVRIAVTSPSPWLPAQMASWHVLIPTGFDPNKPVGSGPFRFDAWNVGESIALSRFDAYQPSPVKGDAIAETVVYNFVPESSTRVSNVLSGASDIATFLPIDALSAFDASADILVNQAAAGTWFIRIATDTEPFGDVRIRQALNLALDLDSFVGVLVHEGSRRLASLYPGPEALGFDPELAPFSYDPDAARTLLQEAGYADGLDVKLEVSSDASQAVCEAIMGQWAVVGIRAELVVTDLGTFNATYADTNAPQLRMISWSPLFDPSTLLNLMWTSDGVLSRYNHPQADHLIQLGGSTFGDNRAQAYKELGHVLHNDAAAIFLWNLVQVDAVSANAKSWTPRPDQWVMGLRR